MSLQEAIKMLRCELEVTQGELAAMLDVDLSTISRWETGKTYPNKSVSRAIISLAERENLSEDCKEYLSQVLNITRRRIKTAAGFGYPQLDRELLCQVADGSSNMIYIIDYKSRELLYVNRVCEKFTGKSFAAAEDKRCFKYIMNKDEPCKLCLMKNYNYSTFYEDNVMSEDGNRFLQIRGKKIRWNKKTVAVTYITDVSEIIKAKNQIIRLSNDLPIGMVVLYLYKDGRLDPAFANENYIRMAEVKGEKDFSHGDLVSLMNIRNKDGKTLIEELSRSVRKERTLNCEFKLKLKEHQEKLIYVCGKLIEENEERYTVCCYLLDLHRMKK